MGLFFRKKEKTKKYCSNSSFNAEVTEQEKQETISALDIKVLGSGCKKCNELEAAAKAALVELKMDTAIEHVTDFAQIASFGVMTTPALVVDGKVVSCGKVLNKNEIAALLKKVRGIQ